MGLAEVGIELLPNRGIKVDDRMRTTKRGVYAAGDVTDRDQFVDMAAYGAKIAANNALYGDSLCYDNAAMSSVVFTDPQVASVGLTEAAARQQGLRVKTSVLPLDHVPRALVARDARGLCSRFSVEYRAVFGESPSASLHRPPDDKRRAQGRPWALTDSEFA